MEKAMPDLKTTSVDATTASPATATNKKKAPGLSFRRFFTKPGVSPYDDLESDLPLAQITDPHRNAISDHNDVEVPKDWAIAPTNIVPTNYPHTTAPTAT